MSDFASVHRARFPGAVSADVFLRATSAVAAPLGFVPDSTIACIGLCRDEMTRSLRDAIQAIWGEAFALGGLGGMLSAGKTGFMAAHAHAPVVDGRERYAYFVMPHIAVDAAGIIGRCSRTGRPGPSTACGALAAFLVALDGGRVRLVGDPLDPEQSRLQQRLMEALPHGRTPDLADVTHLARKVIAEDLERMTELTVDPDQADFIAFTGVQIHGPDGDWVQPGDAWAMVGGVRRPIDVSAALAKPAR